MYQSRPKVERIETCKPFYNDQNFLMNIKFLRCDWNVWSSEVCWQEEVSIVCSCYMLAQAVCVSDSRILYQFIAVLLPLFSAFDRRCTVVLNVFRNKKTINRFNDFADTVGRRFKVKNDRKDILKWAACESRHHASWTATKAEIRQIGMQSVMPLAHCQRRITTSAIEERKLGMRCRRKYRDAYAQRGWDEGRRWSSPKYEQSGACWHWPCAAIGLHSWRITWLTLDRGLLPKMPRH